MNGNDIGIILTKYWVFMLKKCNLLQKFYRVFLLSTIIGITWAKILRVSAEKVAFMTKSFYTV